VGRRGLDRTGDGQSEEALGAIRPGDEVNRLGTAGRLGGYPELDHLHGTPTESETPVPCYKDAGQRDRPPGPEHAEKEVIIAEGRADEGPSRRRFEEPDQEDQGEGTQ